MNEYWTAFTAGIFTLLGAQALVFCFIWALVAANERTHLPLYATLAIPAGVPAILLS